MTDPGQPDRDRSAIAGRDLVFEEIKVADVPALFEVRTATRENALSRKDLEELGITEDSVCSGLGGTYRGWLCRHGERVVGFAMGNGRTGEMWVIAVLPEYESRGIGKELLALVEDWLWSLGWERIWLTTDTDTSLRAYGFYVSRGWADVRVEDGLRTMGKRNPGDG